MSWLYLVIAGCFEIFGVGSIKLFTTKKDLRSLLILILAFCSDPKKLDFL